MSLAGACAKEDTKVHRFASALVFIVCLAFFATAIFSSVKYGPKDDDKGNYCDWQGNIILTVEQRKPWHP